MSKVRAGEGRDLHCHPSFLISLFKGAVIIMMRKRAQEWEVRLAVMIGDPEKNNANKKTTIRKRGER